MAKYIDVDALWKSVTGNIDDCADFLEIIEKQPFVTINSTDEEIKVTNCNHNADADKKVSISWGHENGKDVIYRQDAIELAMQYCPDDDGTCSKADEDIRNLLDALEDLPSAPPKVKSKWEKETRFEGYYRCPVCGRRVDDVTEYGLEESDVFPFCHCGADMRGDVGEE